MTDVDRTTDKYAYDTLSEGNEKLLHEVTRLITAGSSVADVVAHFRARELHPPLIKMITKVARHAQRKIGVVRRFRRVESIVATDYVLVDANGATYAAPGRLSPLQAAIKIHEANNPGVRCILKVYRNDQHPDEEPLLKFSCVTSVRKIEQCSYGRNHHKRIGK